MIQLNLNTGTGNAADSSRNDVSMSGAPLPAAVEGTGALSPAMSPILGPIDAPKDAWIDILESEITSEQQQHQQQQQQQQQQQAIYNSLMHPSMMVTNQDVQQQLQQQQQHLFQQQQQQQSQTQRQSNPQYVTQYTIQPVIQPHPSQQPLFHAASMPSLQTLQSLGVPMPLNLAATQPGAFPSVSVPVSAPAATPDPATATSPAGPVPAGPVPAPDAAGCTSDPALARDKKKKTASEERAALRVERKRDREKRRREDVNSQFDELSALLRRIAPLPGDKKMEGGTETPGVTMPSSAMLAGPSNRADLLQRTCAVLQEAHDERVSLREQCTDLRRRLIESKTAGCSCSGGSGLQHHVMMMIPMMVPLDSVPTGGVPIAKIPMANVQNGLIVQTAGQSTSTLSCPPSALGGQTHLFQEEHVETSRGRSESLALFAELTEMEDKEPPQEKNTSTYAHCA